MTSRTKAWVIIGGSVTILILILGLKQFFTAPQICDTNIKSKTVILLDHSEAITTQTADAIVERSWKHIEEKVPPGEKISIYEITKESKKNLRPIFEACKPRTEGSQYIENAKRVKRDFENFKSKLRENLSAPIKTTNEPVESPIAQAIIDISLDDKHFRSTSSTNLLIFSDFLEYTPKFSLYSCSDGIQAIKDFRASRIGAVERPVFDNVNVVMHIIPRSTTNRSTLNCRTHFWNWFFGNNKGSLNPDSLPG